ncbi:hypothetical protein PS1_007253 [Malus domestica]
MDEVITAADASSNGSTSSQPSILPSNLPLLSAFLSCALAQFLKLFTTWYKEKRWDSRRMLGSGGMPSSHSATVTALAVAIGFQEGTGSAFAIAVVLACVVQLKKQMFDTMCWHLIIRQTDSFSGHVLTTTTNLSIPIIMKG